MSDLSMYELEDISWDEFCKSDDHIVPHHSDEQDKERFAEAVNGKKPCHRSDTGDPISENVSDLTSKEVRSQKLDNVNRSSEESFKEMSNLASESSRKWNNMESANNSFSYPLGKITEAEDGSFFSNNSHQEKDSNDLLYNYNWSEMGNFEDVDRMFRSYGVGESNEDNLGWFNESEDGLKSCEAKCNTSKLNGTSNESNIQKICNLYEDNYWPSNRDDYMCFSNGSDSKDGCVPQGQVNVSNNVMKDQYLENDSFKYMQSDIHYMNSEYNRSNEKREKLNHHHGFKESFDNKIVDLSVETPKDGQIMVDEFVNVTNDNLGDHSNSMNDVSVEATSFHHLQDVMTQLDVRTKLRIRDSLYRLARSAEQRHTSETPSNGDSMVEGKLKCTEFMDIETNTNPIDRSVAHLLFHRPSDISVGPGYGSIVSSPMIDEEYVKREEMGDEIDGN